MRRNTEQVFAAWLVGKKSGRAGSASIWTDGEALYSYGTVLVKRDEEDGTLYFNRTRYSPTTSCQQSGVREALTDMYVRGRSDFVHVRPVYGVPRGYCGPLSAFAS